MKARFRFAPHAVLAIATLGFSDIALAQDAPTPQAEVRDGDIVVTARRREERLQDVPVSISAISGEGLKERAIVDVASLAKISPGMNITASSRGSSTPFIILRGQRLQDTSIVLDAPVLFYVNEVPWMRVNGLNLALFDIDNVQVLRGPQGTLFGKSTTGGAVLINTKKASITDGLSGYAQVTGGTFNLLRGEGAVNIPVTDTLAIRLSGLAVSRDGYMHSRDLAGIDLNNENYQAARVSAHYESGNLTNDFVFNYLHSRNNGTAAVIADIIPSNAALAVLPSTVARLPLLQAEIARNNADYYSIGNDFPLYDRTVTYDFTNTTAFNIESNIVLKNVISYRNIDAPIAYDIDGSNVVTRRFANYTKVHQFTDEIQLQGTGSSFDWIVGAFYLSEKGSDGTRTLDADDRTVGNLTDLYPTMSQSGVEAKNESYSAFVNGTYRFGIDGLSASAGFRISHDNREGTDIQTSAALGATTGNPCNLTLNNGTRVCSFGIKQSATEPSWLFSLNYKVDPDLLLYVAHRHGYRSGGVQNRASRESVALPFRPETVNDVELGAKYDGSIGSDARLSMNFAVYRDWYKDLQRSVQFVPGPGVITPILKNAAQAVIQGVEAEATLRVGGFVLGGSFGYTDAYYKKYTQDTLAGVPQDLSSSGFGFVPKWTYDLRAGYTHNLGATDESVGGNIELHHVGQVYAAETPVPLPYLPGYTVVNASLRWEHVAGTNVDVSANVTNLFDKQYSTYENNYSGSLTLGYTQRYPAPPRRAEVSVAYHF